MKVDFLAVVYVPRMGEYSVGWRFIAITDGVENERAALVVRQEAHCGSACCMDVQTIISK